MPIKNRIIPFDNNKADYDYLLSLIGDASFVLIGESTHGTHEFYNIRAELTKRLIEDKSFDAVAIEGDWPDTYNINRYVRGDKDISSSLEALNGFQRFPTWMWRNNIVVEFINWLYKHNLRLDDKNKTGFYGLDLYSLNASAELVIKTLEKIDYEAAARAKTRYACFEHFKGELQEYGYASALGITETCEDQVVAELIE